MEVQNLNTLLGLSKPIESKENRFCSITLNNQRNQKKSNNIDWNNLTHQIHDSHFLGFMVQILLAIELPNNGELGKKGEFIEAEGGFLQQKGG